MNDETTNWVLAGVGSVIATLAATVASLWKLNESKNAKAITALTERAVDCEKDRSEIKVRLARLEGRLEGGAEA